MQKKNILSRVRRMTGGNRYVVITSQSNDTNIHYLHFYGTKMGLMFYTILKKKIFHKKIRCDSTIIVFHRCKQITWNWLTYSSSCMYQFHEFLSALYFLLQFTLNHGDDLVRTKYLPFLLLSKFELDLQFIQTPKLPINLFYFVPISYM